MATVEKEITFESVADLVDHLGNVPLNRIRLKPPPGLATEKDVLAAENEPRKALCELIDGILVDKVMGAAESLLGVTFIRLLDQFVVENDLGAVLGPDGMLRLAPGRVRIPDVSFISWDRMPGGEFPKKAIPSLAPDLAVEILSPSNTKKEMELKLQDYFQAGTRLVWLIQPKTQTAEVYTAPEEMYPVGKNQSLDGGDVLPGFKLALKELFTVRRRKRR